MGAEALFSMTLSVNMGAAVQTLRPLGALRFERPKPLHVSFSDFVPIGMKGIRPSVLSGARPRIQNASQPFPGGRQ